MANAAHGLGRHVRGYDPALSVHRAAQLSSTVRRVDSLADLLAGADFVTVHVPLLKDTENLIGAAELAMLPAHAVVLNFAREGIVRLIRCSRLSVSGCLSVSFRISRRARGIAIRSG